jgi:hypothetical protein
MNGDASPFLFWDCIQLIELTNRRAADLHELLEGIKQVPPNSIFLHMHQSFLKYHFAHPEYSNDFSEWVANKLGDKALAEKLSELDPFEYCSIEDLRERMIEIIEEHTCEGLSCGRVKEGDEFYFNQSVTIEMLTDLKASNLQEFAECLRKVPLSSIYYHIFEARLRLEKKSDDFSYWIEDTLGIPELAEKIRNMDPYVHSLEDIKKELINLVETHAFQQQPEKIPV